MSVTWSPLRRVVAGLGAAAGVLACAAVAIIVFAPEPPRTVVLEVTGDPPSADVTYRVGSRLEHPGVVVLPWRLEVEVSGGVDVSVVAQSAGDGQVTCLVSVDGEGIPVTATGLFAVAVCRE